MATHPMIRLFLWKVTWDRLLIHVLLRNRGMDISTACPICGLEEEFTEYTLLCCSRTRLIWRIMSGQLWRASIGSWLSPFLDMICKSFAKGSTDTWRDRMAYVTF